MHAYQESWNPQLGDIPFLEQEPTNSIDKYAIAIKLKGCVVGHLSYNIAPYFLNRSINKGTVEVTRV